MGARVFYRAIFLWCVYGFLSFLMIEHSSFTFIIKNCLECIILPLLAYNIFIIFKNIKIQNSKLLNTISATTFGIYLLHDSAIGRISWQLLLKTDKQYESPFFPLMALMDIVLVFSFCGVIDYIRCSFLEGKIKTIADKISVFINNNWSKNEQ